MPKADADWVQKIFEMDSSPSFTIVRRCDITSECTSLELCVESSINLWFLAKRVESWQDHDRRCEKIIADAMETIKSKINAADESKLG